MEFQVLGPLEVRHDDESLALGGPRQRAVLAALVLRCGETIGVDHLASAAWQRPPASLRSNVRTYIAGLRRVLPRRLAGTPDGYRLRVDPGELDLTVFDGLVERAGQARDGADLRTAADLYGRALALWRGQPLAGLTLGPALEAEVAALAERRLHAVERLVEVRIDLGETDGVAGELRALAAENPFRERLSELLMLALDRSGRRAEALDVYTRARHLLAADLGVEPGARLRHLHRDILAGRGQPPSPGAGPRVAAGLPAELPAAVDGFVGRADQSTRLDRLLDGVADAAVVATITGPAGVGKTAFAVHWGHRAHDRFPDGQLFVNLRGFGAGPPVTPSEALVRLMRSVGVPPERIPTDLDSQVAGYRSALAGRRMLILLDNARTAEQIRPLLPGRPGCLVLVTSRNTVVGLTAVDGAHPVPLGPLSTGESSALVRHIVGADRLRNEGDRVADLVRRCDRLPLALRLAGARLATHPHHPVASLFRRMRDGDPLSALSVPGEPAIAVERAFDDSYTVLGPPARRLFRLLSLAPGPDVTVPLAAALLDAPDRGTAEELVDVLVTANLLDEHRPGRYRVHDLLHHYAARRCDAEDAASERRDAIRRAVSWYVYGAAGATAVLDPHRRRGVPLDPGVPDRWPVAFTGHDEALAWCESERVNLVAAVSVAADHGLDGPAWQLPVAMFGFLELRRYWPDWLRTHELGLAAARRSGVRHGEAWLLNSLGIAYKQLRRFDRAAEHLELALTIKREIGDRHGEAVTSNNLGTAANGSGRPEAAHRHYEYALAVFRETGDRWGEGLALSNLAEIHRALGALDTAAEYCRLAHTIRRVLGDRRGEGIVVHNMAEILRAQGRLSEAAVHYRRALRIRHQVGDRWGVARTLTTLGGTLDAAGEPDAARVYWRRALRIFRELGDPQAVQVQDRLDGQIRRSTTPSTRPAAT